MNSAALGHQHKHLSGKKFYFTLALTIFSLISFGQFAIIADKDGFCNVRSTPDTGNNIIARLNNGDFVHVLENSGNWVAIDFTKNGREMSGFVYHNRIQLVAALQSIPLIAAHDDHVVFRKDSIQVVLTRQKFQKSHYRLTYFEKAKNYIEFINGKRYWGTDGELPATAYKSILITMGQKEIALPKAAIDDLFNSHFVHTAVYYDTAQDRLFIHSMNSDGAGGYVVVWKLENGIYKERAVFNGF